MRDTHTQRTELTHLAAITADFSEVVPGSLRIVPHNGTLALRFATEHASDDRDMLHYVRSARDFNRTLHPEW